MTYAEQLLDPRWQKKRLEILSRDEFTCSLCGTTTETLHVHHRYYVNGRWAWEYPDFCFQTLCKDCHADLPGYTEMHRDNGHSVFDSWEIGLNHFGARIFDMAEYDASLRAGDPVP